MQKKLTAAIVAGAIVLGGGAAIAVPAFADSSGSSSTDQGQAARETAREDAIKNALKGLVSDKTLTQDQADKVAQALGKPGALGEGPGGMGGPGFGGHGDGFRGFLGDEADAASKVLGLSVDEIRTALRSGSTLADLAKKQNKSETDLINALVTAAKTNIDQAVKDGRLTQARADEVEKNLPDQVKSIVENGRPSFKGGGPGGWGRGPGGPGGPGGQGSTGTPTPNPGSSTSSSSTSFHSTI